MYNQIIDSLNNHIEKDLRLSIDQKKILQKKHKLSLSDSLDKGHWTTNLCLISSNFTKKSPKELAKNLSSILQNLEGVEKTEIAGPGFLNIFLTQRAFLNQIDEANKDTNLFQSWHAASWRDKLNMLDKFDDDRLVGFGKKIIYQESPEPLPKDI